MELMFQPLRRYADFNGRARRSEFWLWFLFQVIVSIAFGILKGIIEPNNPMGTVFALQMLFGLAILIPNIAVAVRRFHDINRTGWWYAFPIVVTLIATTVYLSVHGAAFINDIKNFASLGPNPSPDQAMAAMSVLMGPILWIYLPALAASIVTLVLNLLDGTPGPNRFGPDPKSRGGDTSVF